MDETTSPLKDSETKGGIHTPQEGMESKHPAHSQKHKVEAQCEVTQRQETANGGIIIGKPTLHLEVRTKATPQEKQYTDQPSRSGGRAARNEGAGMAAEET